MAHIQDSSLLKKMILLALDSSSFFLVSELLPQPIRIAAQVAHILALSSRGVPATRVW